MVTLYILSWNVKVGRYSDLARLCHTIKLLVNYCTALHRIELQSKGRHEVVLHPMTCAYITMFRIKEATFKSHHH